MKKQNSTNHNHQAQRRNWAEEVLCFACACLQLSWRRVVVRKWLNIPTANSDYSADTDSGSDSEPAISFCCIIEISVMNSAFAPWSNSDVLPRIRRRKSETLRAQYINAKEIRVCAATWNVGGRVPPDDLDLDGWLDIDEPADIYVIGLQEIIPLNAGNIFGAEDKCPVSKWENIIRETLNQVPPVNKFKSFSDPPSPSKFKPSEDAPNIEDEIALGSDSDVEEEVYPLNEESNGVEGIKYEIFKGEKSQCDNLNVSHGFDNLTNSVDQEFKQQLSSAKKLDRYNSEVVDTQYTKKLTKTLSGAERIGLSWPEPSLPLLAYHGFGIANSFKPSKSLKASKSLNRYSSFNSKASAENRMQFYLSQLSEHDLESLIIRKRRPPYVRILSKQMVGIFITIWVRRSLRRHIHNLNVSTVGVGIMGYIGNKGSISVSMSIHQTLFCFICTHLTSGEKTADAVKRNDDVQEIHRRTHFNSNVGMGLPRSIYDHERIIWLGDLNYRINLPYELTRELISNKNWPMLLERDQLIKELRKGRVFHGWSEGSLNFAPTYKYELNSDSYCGVDPKAGKRTPAWCDRILSFGIGMKLVSYRRSELKLSDHRPVTATYLVEVEVFSPRKLQRALTFTDAEIEEQDVGLLLLEEDTFYRKGEGHRPRF
ncbi:DNAse I-like superfamily protein [Striga hermonthica]|uniref:DNAse I-like superfamily protein n=1 Tax=Striga hermonthica TaxID=68872 RepID=A0A9N7NE68_STRHE|nr:DNAse I-like superfamily protein [Striga hermonthica]